MPTPYGAQPIEVRHRGAVVRPALQDRAAGIREQESQSRAVQVVGHACERRLEHVEDVGVKELFGDLGDVADVGGHAEGILRPLPGLQQLDVHPRGRLGTEQELVLGLRHQLITAQWHSALRFSGPDGGGSVPLAIEFVRRDGLRRTVL